MKFLTAGTLMFSGFALIACAGPVDGDEITPSPTAGGSGGSIAPTADPTAPPPPPPPDVTYDCQQEYTLPRPETVPDNWVPWTCPPGCGLWIPPDRASMPPPITWEPCPETVGVEGCRQMVAYWSDGDGASIEGGLAMSVDDQGTARLIFGRNAMNGDGDAQTYWEWVVGRVDGELEFAMRGGWPSKCGGYGGTINGDRFGWIVFGPHMDHDRDGLLLGKIGSLVPELPYFNDAELFSRWYVGHDRLLRLDHHAIKVLSVDLKQEADLFDGPVAFEGPPRFVGTDVVFDVGSYVAPSIWAYDSVRGTHALVRYPDDGVEGATNIGTDGKDLVWSYGEGKAPHEFGLYPRMWIMTAPYTTDPEALEPRLVRADMSTLIGSNTMFAVGCGYAGRPTNDYDAQIVRLSDGAAWMLPANDLRHWTEVLGFTCEEAFFKMWDKVIHDHKVVRVPLAALGEPLAR